MISRIVCDTDESEDSSLLVPWEKFDHYLICLLADEHPDGSLRSLIALES